MQYARLGTSDLQVSRLGYGGWPLGCKGWPGVREQEACATLKASVDCGITLFDTAPVYGFGRSEELIGRHLAHVRHEIVLATKCGLVWDDRGRVRHDCGYASVTAQCEASLRRLRVAAIDLYQIHWPDPDTPLAETMGALADLQARGLIRHIGFSNATMPLLEEARRHGTITAIQNPFNLLQRAAEADILPWCRAHGIAFLGYSPLAQGLLAGAMGPGYCPGRRDVRHLNPLFTDPDRFREALATVAALPKPAARAALRFASGHPGVTAVLVGMTRTAHLRRNLLALDAPAPD